MKAALALLLIAAPAVAQEDAAHRADRERTEQLNRQVSNATARHARANAQARDRYRAQRSAYQRSMAEWRKLFDACEAGDRSAC